MGKKLEFRTGVREKVQKILGLRPKPEIPMVDNKKRVDIISLINITRVIEDNDYKSICRELEKLKKGNPDDLKFVAKNTKSIDVCMAIVNGDFPGEAKELAEKRLGTLGSEFDEIKGICNNIRIVEHAMINGYLSVKESADLLQENINLSDEIKKLGERDLFDLVAGDIGPSQLNLYKIIVNGDYPEDIQAIAEAKIEQLNGQKPQKDL